MPAALAGVRGPHELVVIPASPEPLASAVAAAETRVAGGRGNLLLGRKGPSELGPSGKT